MFFIFKHEYLVFFLLLLLGCNQEDATSGYFKQKQGAKSSENSTLKEQTATTTENKLVPETENSGELSPEDDSAVQPVSISGNWLTCGHIEEKIDDSSVPVGCGVYVNKEKYTGSVEDWTIEVKNTTLTDVPKITSETKSSPWHIRFSLKTDFLEETFTVKASAKIDSAAREDTIESSTIKDLPSCSGVYTAGYCWYYGAPSQSCDQVCSSHGGCNLPGTKDFAGSGGSNENCDMLCKLFGNNISTLTNNYGAPYNELGCTCNGCCPNNHWYYTATTTCGAAVNLMPRICACIK